jgi:hypothetical protein
MCKMMSSPTAYAVQSIQDKCNKINITVPCVGAWTSVAKSEGAKLPYLR